MLLVEQTFALGKVAIKKESERVCDSYKLMKTIGFFQSSFL